MTTTTLLLCAKTTGSVLTAVSVAAAPSGEVPAALLAGDPFPACHFGNPGDASFALPPVMVPADELAVFAVDSKSVPVEQAFLRFVDLEGNAPKPLGASPKITVDAATTPTGLKVTFTPDTVGKAAVWMRVDPVDVNSGTAAQTITAQVNVAVANSTVSVQMPVQTFKLGDYRALVTVPGFTPSLSKFTVA